MCTGYRWSELWVERDVSLQICLFLDLETDTKNSEQVRAGPRETSKDPSGLSVSCPMMILRNGKVLLPAPSLG